jgi:hypothetical protein
MDEEFLERNNMMCEILGAWIKRNEELDMKEMAKEESDKMLDVKYEKYFRRY